MTPEGTESWGELEEEQLCTSCTTPNPTTAHFCAKCGAPLSSFASIAPFEHLFAEGFIYRAAAERPRRLITVIGVWVLFGLPTFGMFTLFASTDIAATHFYKYLLFMQSPVTLFSIAIIWRTTRSYLMRKKLATAYDDSPNHP